MAAASAGPANAGNMGVGRCAAVEGGGPPRSPPALLVGGQARSPPRGWGRHRWRGRADHHPVRGTHGTGGRGGGASARHGGGSRPRLSAPSTHHASVPFRAKPHQEPFEPLRVDRVPLSRSVCLSSPLSCPFFRRGTPFEPLQWLHRLSSRACALPPFLHRVILRAHEQDVLQPWGDSSTRFELLQQKQTYTERSYNSTSVYCGWHATHDRRGSIGLGL